MDRGLTTDKVINNIAERKAAIMDSLLELLKKSAVDCHLHKKNHPDVECFSYPVNIKDDELVIKYLSIKRRASLILLNLTQFNVI